MASKQLKKSKTIIVERKNNKLDSNLHVILRK